jgi:hypothetical protein
MLSLGKSVESLIIAEESRFFKAVLSLLRWVSVFTVSEQAAKETTSTAPIIDLIIRTPYNY